LYTVSGDPTDFAILAAECWSYVWSVRTVRHATKKT